MVDVWHSLYFLRRYSTFASFAFASSRSWAFVMFVDGVCFQRCKSPLVRAIVREQKRWNTGEDRGLVG